MNVRVTVCVLTYNPDWTKFRNTLKSIICQKGVDFDVVISDDGSKDNCFDKAEEYLQGNNFSAYCFIANKQNQGTVKNAISALQHTESKYVKLISPGDFLYDENVLAKFTDFAEKNPATAYFGNAVYYSVDNQNEITIYDDKRNPKDVRPWIKKSKREIKRNYLYRRDYILGASVFCNRTYLYNRLTCLKDIVTYTEDMFLKYGIVSGDKILYVNKTIIFYEYGLGISTNEKTLGVVWSDLLKFNEWLYNNKKISVFAYFLLKTPSRFLRFLIQLVLDPINLLNKLAEHIVTMKYGYDEFDENNKKQSLDNLNKIIS